MLCWHYFKQTYDTSAIKDIKKIKRFDLDKRQTFFHHTELDEEISLI